jgi:hypothetical protein
MYVAGYPRERISFGSGAAHPGECRRGDLTDGAPAIHAFAFPAGLGAFALPCVALILAIRSALLARSNPLGGTI